MEKNIFHTTLWRQIAHQVNNNTKFKQVLQWYIFPYILLSYIAYSTKAQFSTRTYMTFLKMFAFPYI